MKQFSRAHIYARPDNRRARTWVPKIEAWLKRHRITLSKAPGRGDLLIVLGGDGTILEATKKFYELDPLIMGLNLGSVGFLASVREPGHFLHALDRVARNSFAISEKIMLEGEVARRGKSIAKLRAINEIIVENPLSMVCINVRIKGHSVQKIRGTGALVATPTGSTAYSLSTHGPILTPDMRSLIVSEILDHNIPTPSMVLDADTVITFHIDDFREHQKLSLTATGEAFDVIAISDGDTIVPLKKNDHVLIHQSKRPVRFVELEQNYFFKSLEEKFSFT